MDDDAMKIEKAICDKCGTETKLEESSAISFWSGQFSDPATGSLRNNYDEVDLCLKCLKTLAQRLIRNFKKPIQMELLKELKGNHGDGNKQA